jgi:hypothetical protein
LCCSEAPDAAAYLTGWAKQFTLVLGWIKKLVQVDAWLGHVGRNLQVRIVLISQTH